MNIATVRDNVRGVAETWAPQRAERLERRALNPADFDVLHDAGLTLTGVPTALGGVWEGAARSMRPVAGLFRTLAAADPSVALVATMHPGVLIAWSEDPVEPPPDPAAWRAQRERILGHARDGAWVGTIASEPGGGGDLMATRATAVPAEDGLWRMTGDKHMGSGSGVTSFMMTVAVPEGADAPDIFLIDARDLPWDGSAGATLVREWDGHGMAATQSHAFRYDNVAVERHALMGGAMHLVPKIMPVAATLFTSVVMGVLDAALAEARRRLVPKMARMTAYERVGWTKAVNDAWLAEQAFEAMLRAIERDAPMPDAQRGKLAISELVESVLLDISRVIGGSSFSRSGPFGQWSQDVRALGFLRPPWSLAHDQLFEVSFDD